MPVRMGPILVQLQETTASNQYSADTCTAGSSSHDQRTPGLFASYSHHTTRCARGGRDGLAASLAGWAATGVSGRAALAGPLLAPDSGGSQDSALAWLGCQSQNQRAGSPQRRMLGTRFVDNILLVARGRNAGGWLPICATGPGSGASGTKGSLIASTPVQLTHLLFRPLHLRVCEMSRRAVCIPIGCAWRPHGRYEPMGRIKIGRLANAEPANGFWRHAGWRSHSDGRRIQSPMPTCSGPSSL